MRRFGIGLYAFALLLSRGGIPVALAQPAQPGQAERVSEANASTQGGAGASRSIVERLRKHVARPGGLTAEQVADRAAATSIDAEMARLEAVTARADRSRLTATTLPRLELSARYTRLSSVDETTLGPGSGSFVVTPNEPGPLTRDDPLQAIPASAFSFPQILNQYHLQASLRVPISDYVFSVSSAYEGIQLVEQSAKLNRQAAELAVRAQAKAVYYDWVQAVLQTAVARQSLVQSRASLARTEAAFEAGRASRADVLGAKSVVANARLLVEQARARARISEQNVRVIMHDESGEPYAIGENVLKVPPRKGDEGRFDLLYKEAEQRRLELRALRANMAAFEHQRDVVASNGLPRLEAFGNVYYSRPNQRFIPQQDEWRASWDVGVQLSWSPNDFGSANADARKIEVQRERLLLQRRQIRDALRREVLQALASLQETEAALDSAQASVQAAEEAYAVQKLLYENGRATTLELLQAESQLLQARVTLINTLIGLRLANVALEHATGRDIPAAQR